MNGAVAAIAANTVRDAVRNRVLYALVFFALIMIGTSAVLATLSYVERERILQDVGLGAIRFFGAAIAIFMGVGLIHREVERRTIYTILSKPVTSAQFLAGKYLGLVTTLWLQLSIMIVAFVLASLASGAPLDSGHALALALMAVELAVVVAFATLFSSFATPFSPPVQPRALSGRALAARPPRPRRRIRQGQTQDKRQHSLSSFSKLKGVVG